MKWRKERKRRKRIKEEEKEERKRSKSNVLNNQIYTRYLHQIALPRLFLNHFPSSTFIDGEIWYLLFSPFSLFFFFLIFLLSFAPLFLFLLFLLVCFSKSIQRFGRQQFDQIYNLLNYPQLTPWYYFRYQ